MLTRTFASLVLLLMASSASAALPPFYQSAREIQAVVSSGDVAQKLGSGRAISSIERTDRGYSLVAGDCALFVEIVYLAPPPGFAGPARFELKVGEVSCLP